MKKLFLILTLLLALFTSVVFAANGSPQPATKVNIQSTASVLDYAKLLKANEVTALQEQIKTVEQKHKVKVLVHTAQSINGGKARDYARTMVDYTLANQKAIICVITMSDRQWYIAANRGMKEYAVSQEFGIDYISKEMVPYLKKGEYGKAFSTYVTKADELMTFAAENGHAKSEDDEFDVFGFGISLFIALFIGYSFREHLISQMSNVNPAIEANEYLLKDTFNLEDSQDTFLYTRTQVIPKSKGRSSDGGGSDGDCGGSGGGGSF